MPSDPCSTPGFGSTFPFLLNAIQTHLLGEQKQAHLVVSMGIYTCIYYGNGRLIYCIHTSSIFNIVYNVQLVYISDIHLLCLEVYLRTTYNITVCTVPVTRGVYVRCTPAVRNLHSRCTSDIHVNTSWPYIHIYVMGTVHTVMLYVVLILR